MSQEEIKRKRNAFWSWIRNVKYEYDSKNVCFNQTFFEYIENKYGVCPIMTNSHHGDIGFTGEYTIVNEETYFLEKLKGLKI